MIETIYRKLINLKYGSDLENPVKSQYWTSQHNYRFEQKLLPKLKLMLKEMLNNKKGEEPTDQNHEEDSKIEIAETKNTLKSN